MTAGQPKPPSLAPSTPAPTSMCFFVAFRYYFFIEI